MSSFKNDIFKGKVILISGGATGICYQISKLFLMHSATVYIISRKIDNINKAIESLKKQTNNQMVFGSSCDVRDEKSVEETIKTVVSKFGTIDVLINGAAGNFLCPIQKLSANAFKTVLMIDTVGTFLLSKYANEHAFKNGGVIINISAYLHQTGVAMQVHAGTAKAGVDAITHHLAVELGPKNIRVVGICPGTIQNTEGFERLSGGKITKDVQSLVPLQRFGKGQDIAKCALFLASDAASYITGQTIIVDGGISLTFPNFPFLSPDFVKSYSKKAKL